MPEKIRSTAFFPGGAGPWSPDPERGLFPMPVGGVMVLGYGFYSEVGYGRFLANRAKADRRLLA